MDIFDVVIKENIDFMFVDIWMLQAEEKALKDTQKIWQKIPAKSVAFWTQELEFIYWCSQNGVSKSNICKYDAEDWVTSTGLPIYTMKNFVWWAMRAAQNLVL